jgi:hypothetical protein
VIVQEPFNYEQWVELLVKWIVASDAPFTEVEVPEFIELLQYTHQGSDTLHIPSSWTVKQRALKMSKTTMDEIKQLFEVSSDVSVEAKVFGFNVESSIRNTMQRFRLSLMRGLPQMDMRFSLSSHDI